MNDCNLYMLPCANANRGVPHDGGMQRAVIAVGHSHRSYPFTFLTGWVLKHRNAW